MKAEFGMTERILALIKAAGMTAKEFTVRMGISPTTVSEWKSKRTQPSVEHVRRMSEIFNVSTDYIITGHEFRDRLREQTKIDRLTAETMGEAFAQLTSEHREVVTNFILMCLENLNKTAPEERSPEPAAEEAAHDTHDMSTKEAVDDFFRRRANGEFN